MTGFRKHFRKMKTLKKIDTILYRHFKSNGQSPSKIVIQPVLRSTIKDILTKSFINKGLECNMLDKLGDPL